MKMFTLSLAVLALAVPLSGQSSGASAGARSHDKEVSNTNRTVFPAWTAGRWQSAPYELALTSDLHREVYGPGAKSTRLVTMTIAPSGEGTFTVTSSVRDNRGRLVAGTQEVEDVRFAVGEMVEEPGRQPHFETHVTRAERRFVDDPASTFAHDGVKLMLFPSDAAKAAVEIRFETPEGTGSFWETLRRAPAPASRSGRG